jgi:hypothetical protein
MAKVFAQRSIVFTPDALDVLADSFVVDTELLPSKSDMSRRYTEAYLSK